MSRGQQRGGVSPERQRLATGDLKDDFTRRAQTRSDANSVSVNLTDKGAWLHGIEQGTDLTILVFEEGIWITPESGGDTDAR